jgi:hypothetical protein
MAVPVNIRFSRTAVYRRHAAVQLISVAEDVNSARQFNASMAELAARTATTNIAACAPKDLPVFIVKLIDVKIIAKIMDDAS